MKLVTLEKSTVVSQGNTSVLSTSLIVSVATRLLASGHLVLVVCIMCNFSYFAIKVSTAKGSRKWFCLPSKVFFTFSLSSLLTHLSSQ